MCAGEDGGLKGNERAPGSYIVDCSGIMAMGGEKEKEREEGGRP